MNDNEEFQIEKELRSLKPQPVSDAFQRRIEAEIERKSGRRVIALFPAIGAIAASLLLVGSLTWVVSMSTERGHDAEAISMPSPTLASMEQPTESRFEPIDARSSLEAAYDYGVVEAGAQTSVQAVGYQFTDTAIFRDRTYGGLIQVSIPRQEIVTETLTWN